MIERSSNVNRAYQSQSYQNQSRQNQPYQMQSYDNGGREATDNKHEELAKDVIWEREENLSFPTLETTKEEVTKEQVSFSFKNIFTSGLRGVIAKAVGFWNDDGGNDKNNLHEKEQASEASSAISTALLEQEKTNVEENLPEEHVEKVSDVEGIVSGELKTEPGNGKRLLQRLGELIYSVTSNWREPEKPRTSLPANVKGTERGTRNYLLDSYNKSGQYSTLAKDSSAEGKFKAKV
ncbi:hypothetical protein [Kineothrix sp. MB12-C1]|uniref:hypothetical protein n=1 Tax=Kineothrix sp. MB12-C1 TaxID=3070215 RepID=UPI0027D3174B|nr:hypothetical protein [Kineothrix sp. MB12-C1]WMC92182.1 hypothetical protein RBB56_15205 [Kineothrix sp. MB12-C1]